MARNAVASVTASGRGQFALADDADDVAIRSLLRESVMDGAVRLTLEREPSYFGGLGGEPGEHQAVVWRGDDGAVLGIGARVVRRTWRSGAAELTGYLSQLRLAHTARGSFHAVRRGYNVLRGLHEADGRVRVYLSSIMKENTRARRLLEAGIRGLPRYRAIDTFETSLISAAPGARPRGVSIRRGESADLERLIEFMNQRNREHRFSPVWCVESVRALEPFGITPSCFVIAERSGSMLACGAAWDQRCYKQTVVRGYHLGLRAFRPIVNACAAVVGAPQLPRIGEPLALRSLAFAACMPGEEESFLGVVRGAADLSREEGTLLVAGFAGRHPLSAVMRRCRRRVLASVLYAVSWPDGHADADACAADIVHPEVALL